MPSTISAGTSAGTALNITSDTTGNLAFQTNNGVTALSIDTSQNVTFANNVTYSGTITATTGFSGNGAGLTALNASNVASGTLAVARGGTGNANGSANSIANSGGWSVTPSGTKLFFNYNGANVASLDSSGNLICLANITAYGTP
jgi:hypothetical protein